MAYAAIALSWFHEIPTGNELVLSRVAADYWRALYIFTIVVLVIWRVLVPLAGALRYRLRVAEVTREGPGVVSLRITGRNLDRMGAPRGSSFSGDSSRGASGAPRTRSRSPRRRKTARFASPSRGSATIRRASLRSRPAQGARRGPVRRFHRRARHGDKAVLIAGGIGITPIRALMETMNGDLIVLYRALTAEDVIFRDELDELARPRTPSCTTSIGDHNGNGRDLLAPAHLLELVPDLVERDVFLCGPPAMAASIREERPRGPSAAAPDPRRALCTDLEGDRLCART